MTDPRTESLTREGARLTLHSFTGPSPAAVVFYVHGTQSHAGWLFETGPELAARGVGVYALDRRGSGASDGARGDATSFRPWLDDNRSALAIVRGRHPGVPLTILGQSLGGCIAVAVAVEAVSLFDALLLSAPAFELLHGKLPAVRLRAIRRERSSAVHPVRVPNDHYTKDPEKLAFMEGDALMVRALTGRFLAAQIDLEEHVRQLPDGCLTCPAALLVARNDPMIPVGVVLERFRRLAPGGVVLELSADEHYLEFSRARSRWLSAVTRFALTKGSQLAVAGT